MKRYVVPGIPFLLSFALSLSTAGAHCYWQDSGFFLVAVKELGVLYPPGFALYVLLCRAWTLALWWVDFTYAVHLFSATCAALAAGTLAVASRDLLRTKGPLFHTAEEEGPLAEWVGVCIGCLAASGYTFWAAAILAKVYAFYFLILTLLIWRMIRADESGKPRDFTIVAVLIGLAWQAHPSATNAGLALVLFVAFHRRVVGWKGLAWRSGLAALCALSPLQALPVMMRGGSSLQLGDPSGWTGFWAYATGLRFTSIPGVFGLDSTRVASVGRYFWEEFLVVGILLAGGGVWRLWRENRRLLAGVACWVLPVLVVTVLFKLEGQHDFWMVAAWIPLWMVAALGLSLVGKGRELAVLLALMGTVWAVVVNRKDLDQREYTQAEQLGVFYLQRLPSGATLETASDDLYGSALYQQRVRGHWKEVDLWSPGVTPARLSYFDDRNHYFEKPPHSDVVPDGPVFRRPGGYPLGDWGEPIPAENLPSMFRRERGQFVERTKTEVRVHPEPYEKRFLRVLLLARKTRADSLAKQGKLEEASLLYDTLFALDPDLRTERTTLFQAGILDVGLNRLDRAQERFKQALELGLEGEPAARACYFLAALTGDKPEGAEWKAKALASPDLAPELRAKLEGK